MSQNKKVVFPIWIRAVFLFMILLLLTGGTLFFKYQQQHQKQEVENRLLSIAQLKARDIENWRAERLADATVVSEQPALIEKLIRQLENPTETQSNELNKLLLPVLEQYHYADIQLIDPEGNLHFSLNRETEFHVAVSGDLREALDKQSFVWTDLHRGPEFPFLHLSVVAPIFSGNNGQKYSGSLVFVSNASEYLYPLIQSWPTPSKTSETLLIRKDGNDVLFLNELRHQNNTALKLRIPLTQADLPAAMAISGIKGIVTGKDYRGVDVIAAILPIKDSPWFMVAKVDMNEAFAEWRFRSVLILGLIFGLVAILVILGIGIWQRNLKDNYRVLYQSEAALRASIERQTTTLKSIGDAVIATDAEGRVEIMNPVAEKLTGWTEAEARGRALRDIFNIINENSGKPVDDPVTKVLESGSIINLANNTVLVARNGSEIPIEDSGAPIRGEHGKILGVVLVFRDQSDERIAQRLTEARFSLSEYAGDHTLDELLQNALDKIESLLSSSISFYHFVEADQKTITLQQWSTRTSKEFSKAGDKGLQYDIDKAGVWGECIKARKTVIHNDYASLKHKKGMPEDHAEVVREIVTPVIRDRKLVAILGVGNKKSDYTEKDAQIVSQFADVTWEIISQKRAQEALQKSEERLIEAQHIARMGDFVWDIETGIVSWSEGLFDLLGYDKSESIDIAKVNKDIHHPDDVERVNQWLTAALESEEENPEPNEYRLIRHDKEVIHVKTSITIRRGAEQKIQVFGTVQDISDLKLAEQALQRSEALLREAQRVAHIGHWELDPEIGTPVWSEEIFRIFDLDPNKGEPSFVNHERHVHPDDWMLLENAVYKAQNEGIPFDIVFRLTTRAGDLKWMHAIGNPLKDEKGNIVKLFGTAQDVSDMKRAEIALEESRKNLSLAQEIASIGSWNYNIKTGDLYWSDELYRIYGFDPKQKKTTQALGFELIHPNDRPSVEQAFNKAINEGRDFNIEYRIKSAAGKECIILSIGRAEKDRSGNIVEIYGTGQDITERKQAESELEKYRKKLEELVEARTAELKTANTELESFAYTASHDLRTPLRAIHGFTSILLEEYVSKLDDEAKRLGRSIQRNTTKMGQLIDDLLKFSRLGRSAISFNRINMKKLIEDTYLELTEQQERSQVEFTVGDVPEINADYNMIRQVWLNLISNALKFSNKKEKANISISAEQKNQSIVYKICDNGVGFDMKYKDKLFGVFQRLHSEKEFEGTGVGLALVQRIIQRHGGNIWAESALGKGTTVYFSLPVK